MKIVTPDMTLDQLREMVSDKEWQFCHNLLLTTNASKAAIMAGFSEKTAKQQASRMLTTRKEIQRIVEILRGEREDRLQVRQDNVLREVGRIALCDPRKAFDENNCLLPPTEWPDEIASSISSIKVMEIFDGQGVKIGETKEIKFWSKTDALTLAARHLGMLKDNLTIDITDQLADRLARAKSRVESGD